MGDEICAKINHMRSLLFFLLLFFYAIAYPQNGTISGVVTDKQMNNEPLPFANVLLAGTKISTTADVNGHYSISATPGNYIVEFSFLGYKTAEEQVAVTASQETILNIALDSAAETLNGVVVRGIVNRERETALLLEQKNAVEIRQSIGAQEFSRKGVSDVEEGLTKITGITKVGSRGIFVRGLEDRYNNLLVNDLAVPSNSPFRKIIPLDLFPTDIVGAIEIFKTFNPGIYGDFAGATFNIRTSKGSKSTTKISLGTSFSTNNNLQDFVVSADASGSKGFFGLTGKDRQLPGVFGSVPSNQTLSGQQSLKAFKSGFGTKTIKSPLNTSLGITHSEKFNFDNGRRLTYLLSINSNNEYVIRTGADRTVKGGNTITYNKKFQTTSNEYKTSASALLGMNYKTERLELAATSFYLRTTINAVQDQSGIWDNQVNVPNYLIRTNQFDQSDYFTAQLSGKFFLSEDQKHSLRGGISFSKTSYIQPDRKFFGGSNQGADQIITSYGGNNFLRQYLDIDGAHYISALAEYALKFGSGDRHQITIGYNGKTTETESSYRFVSASNGPAFTVAIEQIQETINSDLQQENFFFRESSNAQYRTKLTESVNAAYASATFNYGSRWTLDAGLRIEQSTRKTLYRENGSFADPFIPLQADKTYFLPSVNFKYGINERSNLRLAAGKTYTQPVMIESLPLTYINADGTSVIGNPFLKNSDNINLDFKYEIFPSRTELFAISVFGKTIDNAIERSFVASAGGFSTTFLNTGDATLFGAEVEAIVDLGRISNGLSAFSIGLNTSLMQTKVDAGAIVTGSNGMPVQAVETHQNRDLQGASKWLVNGDLKYEFNFNNEWSNTISLVYSVFGKRIFSVGSYPMDHIYELPVSKLDVVWKSRLSKHFDLKLSADNILDPEVQFELGADSAVPFGESSRVLQDYRRGVKFSAGLGYTF